MSESSDDCHETASDVTTEDDYSDDDHVYLISSVANLRRRELMNLKTNENLKQENSHDQSKTSK